MKPDYTGMDQAALLRMLNRRDHQMELSTRYWIRAAEAALAGDSRELYNRVEMSKLTDFEIVQS